MSLKIDHTPDTEQLSEETRNEIFTRLKPEDIEQFYMAYQLWSQQQQIKRLQLQMLALNQKISENATSMEQLQPSAIALATLAQLQAYGVEDIDLLDRMLERGDEWLDHSLQLLERCEQLDLIGGNYTQWCEHAMEGAYEWMNSIADPGTGESESQETKLASPNDNPIETGIEVTEAQLLQKLMDEETDGTIQIAALQQKPRTTQPLTITDEYNNTDEDTKKRATIQPPKSPLITQPLAIINEQGHIVDNTQKVATIEPPKSPLITQPLAIRHEQIETSPPTQVTTETDQENNVTFHTMNRAKVNPEPQINSENVTITDHTHTNLYPDSLSQLDATSDIDVLLINSKIEDTLSPRGSEVQEIVAVESTIENDEKDIYTPPVANKDENKIQIADHTENRDEVAPTTPDRSKEAIHLKNAMVTTERVDQNKDEQSIRHTSDVGKRQDGEPKDLQPPKKGALKKKRGFFRWLLAKIARN